MQAISSATGGYNNEEGCFQFGQCLDIINITDLELEE
jgi:hypothetical protein